MYEVDGRAVVTMEEMLVLVLVAVIVAAAAAAKKREGDCLSCWGEGERENSLGARLELFCTLRPRAGYYFRVWILERAARKNGNWKRGRVGARRRDTRKPRQYGE